MGRPCSARTRCPLLAPRPGWLSAATAAGRRWWSITASSSAPGAASPATARIHDAALAPTAFRAPASCWLGLGGILVRFRDVGDRVGAGALRRRRVQKVFRQSVNSSTMLAWWNFVACAIPCR
jgi:hypothetical protein